MDVTVYLFPMTAEMYHAYFREFDNDPELYLDKTRFAHYVYDPEAVNRYIERQKEKQRICFAIMAGDEMAGELVIKDIEPHKSASFGICMKNDGFKGRGLGTQAERLALDYIFTELDIPTVCADVIRPNLRSQHVLERIGFRLTGEDENFKYYRMDRETHV